VGVEVYFHKFLSSTLDGCGWSGSHFRHYTLWERSPGTHGIGSWNLCRREESLFPARNSPLFLCCTAHSLVPVLTELSELY